MSMGAHARRWGEAGPWAWRVEGGWAWPYPAGCFGRRECAREAGVRLAPRPPARFRPRPGPSGGGR
ncbi:hypothetical protein GCM10022244_24740 [Streptomyces gulbargensis]|uniref:Uncharacterized protein n=1 Tax=Streptomyces gulbargensis TaxID=364901 RepID=A0ABP7M3T8_9ACTN